MSVAFLMSCGVVYMCEWKAVCTMEEGGVNKEAHLQATHPSGRALRLGAVVRLVSVLTCRLLLRRLRLLTSFCLRSCAAASSFVCCDSSAGVLHTSRETSSVA